MLRSVTVTSNVTNGLPVYIDSYTIMQLSTSDRNREIRCTANSIDSSVMASGNIILDVFGKNCFMRAFMNLLLSNIYIIGNALPDVITLKPYIVPPF